jgi:hypothetical protein
MATVITDLSMSLDGFVAYPNDEAGALSDWYNNGDVPVQSPDGSVGRRRPGRCTADTDLHRVAPCTRGRSRGWRVHLRGQSGGSPDRSDRRRR